MRRFLTLLAAEDRANPWMLPGVLLTGSAALGVALPELLALASRVLG